MNRRLAIVVATLSALVSGQAAGQTRALDAHFFRPALFSGGIFAIDRAALTSKWEPAFKFFFNHEATPLRLKFPQPGCTANCIGQQDMISSAQVFNLQAQFGIMRWLEIGLDLPLVRHSLTSNPAPDKKEGFELLSAADPITNTGYPNVSPMDMRVGLKGTLLNTSGFALALAVEGTIPFGDELVFAGEKTFTVHPRLLASLDHKALTVAANVGYHYRPQSLVLWDDPETLEERDKPLFGVGQELTFGAGAAYRFHRVIGVGAEFYGAVPLRTSNYNVLSSRTEYTDKSKCPGGVVPCEVTTSSPVAPPTAPVTEALGGVILTPVTGVDIAVGAGGGITGDARRVAMRLFAGISWLPGAEAPSIGVRDRDGDAVPDNRDQCPDQAEDKDGFQDEDGCPDRDNDGDGVLDDIDKCVTEAEDKDGFQDEDGCPDLDNDGDGIADDLDKCPNEAEDKDGFQDEDGCPDLDNDGDGIADDKDKCPAEPETANGYQDEDGCPDTPPTGVQVAGGKINIPEQIQFKRGSAVLDPVSYKLLNEIGRKIIANPQIGVVRIEGHTDDSGSKEANDRLSQARADSVKAYLVGKGVPADRLQTAGYGSSRPIDPRKTDAARAKNRRVEFVVIQSKDKNAPVPTP
jgi:outer membrane protein OmpA-like peptidoglycan-associated protein